MKTVWTIVTTLALAHLVALFGFVSWLVADGRLNADRVESIRTMLSERIADQRAQEQAEQAKTKQVAAQAEANGAMRGDPIDASQRIDERQAVEEKVRQLLLRREREREDLRNSLESERRDLDAEWAQLKKERQAFQQYLDRLKQTTGTDQFKKAITTLEGQKPRDAMTVLQALLDDGKKEEVVSYLNAMDERARNRIFAEFSKVDSALAADLLETLRTRGITPPGAEEPAQ